MALIIPELVVGLALLILGRRLFWLFVAGVGFWIGATLAPRLFPGQSQTVILVIAVVLGLVGAAFAALAQRLAVGLAGFIVGGYVALNLGNALGLGGALPAWLGTIGGRVSQDLGNTGAVTTSGLPIWFFFVAGGIIGAILVLALFDWALVILSSIAGAALVTDAVRLGQTAALVVFLVLLAAGMVIQASQLRRR